MNKILSLSGMAKKQIKDICRGILLLRKETKGDLPVVVIEATRALQEAVDKLVQELVIKDIQQGVPAKEIQLRYRITSSRYRHIRTLARDAERVKKTLRQMKRRDPA